MIASMIASMMRKGVKNSRIMNDTNSRATAALFKRTFKRKMTLKK